MSDTINPDHYRTHPSGIECITLAEWMSFPIGSAFKYLFRYGLKGDSREQLEKARWFVQRKMGHPTGPAPELDRNQLPTAVKDAYRKWEAADQRGNIHDAMVQLWASVFSIAPTADLMAAIVCIDDEIATLQEEAAA